MEKKDIQSEKDNSSIAIENGKKSEISDPSIQNANPTIFAPSFMNKLNSSQGQNSINIEENNKNKESFENVDLTTALSNLSNGMNQGFADVKNEITGMKNEIKDEISSMKKEMSNGFKLISTSIDKLADNISKQSNNPNKDSRFFNNYYVLFALIIAICLYFYFNKNNNYIIH